MSYDLNFWKYRPGVSLDHQATYEKLSDGQTVDGLEDLPIADMLARLNEVFADWDRVDDETWESDRGTFQVFTTPQFFRVDCYGMDGEDMIRIVEVASEFGCPLYDPQVTTRYDGA
ncbi:MAG: hypothetical protein ACF8PN_08615 [Phycisphaerales bacterium]